MELANILGSVTNLFRDDLNRTDSNRTDSKKKEPKNEKESVGLWHERIRIARQNQDDWARKSGANRFIEEYNGHFKVFFHGLKGQIPVPPINEVFSYCQADLAHTYNRDPKISVNPKAGTVKGAKLWEAILNYYWRKLKSKEEIEPEIIEKDLVGYAFHKVGLEKKEDETGLGIPQNKLYSKRINWRDMVWNIGAKNPPEDCLWMAQRIVKPLQEAKRTYKTVEKLEGVSMPEVDKLLYDTALYKDDIKVAIFWEVWNKMDHEILLLAEGLPDKYVEPPRPWPTHLVEMEEFPFLMYWDYFAPDQPRPLSNIAPWEPQIVEKMILLATAINHSKRWNRQMIVTRGSISTEALDKYERGDDGAIIENSGSGDLDKNVKLLDYGTLPVDFYLLMDRLSAIERDTNGQPEFERGGVTKTTTRTEGELLMIQQGAKGRSDRKIDRFETHLENIARHMKATLEADFDFAGVVQITGAVAEEIANDLGENFDPITKSVHFTPEEIAGEYDVEIKAGSTLPLDATTKMQVLDSVLQTLGRIGPAGVSPLVNAIITEKLEGYDIKSLKEAWQAEQEASDQEAKLKQQETDSVEAKARTQAAKNVAQADKIGAEADQIRLSTPHLLPGMPITTTLTSGNEVSQQ